MTEFRCPKCDVQIASFTSRGELTESAVNQIERRLADGEDLRTVLKQEILEVRVEERSWFVFDFMSEIRGMGYQPQNLTEHWTTNDYLKAVRRRARLKPLPDYTPPEQCINPRCAADLRGLSLMREL